MFTISTDSKTLAAGDYTDEFTVSTKPSQTSTKFQRFDFECAATVVDPEVDINDSDPTLDAPILDRQLNFDIAQEFSQLMDRDERVKAYSQYYSEKDSLIGETVEVTNKRDKKHPVVWKVRNDIKKDTVSAPDDSPCGVKNFDFNRNTKNSKSGNSPRTDLSHLLLHLWPGDYRAQVDAMNREILKDNDERLRRGRSKVPLVSYREMGVFFGIFLVARLEGKRGSSLWVGNADDGEGYRLQVDISRIMTESRHNQLRSYFDIFFADHLKKGEDAWWKVMGGVNGFNQNRRTTIKAGKEKTPDESMSAYQPRTTPRGKF